MDIQNYQPNKVMFSRAEDLEKMTLNGLMILDIQLLTRPWVYITHPVVNVLFGSYIPSSIESHEMIFVAYLPMYIHSTFRNGDVFSGIKSFLQCLRPNILWSYKSYLPYSSRPPRVQKVIYLAESTIHLCGFCLLSNYHRPRTVVLCSEFIYFHCFTVQMFRV